MSYYIILYYLVTPPMIYLQHLLLWSPLLWTLLSQDPIVSFTPHRSHIYQGYVEAIMKVYLGTAGLFNGYMMGV